MTNVIFDVGNVLLDWNAHRVYRGLLPSDAEIDAFFDEVGFFAWNLEQDRGRSFADGIAELSERYPGRADLIARYDSHWQDSIIGPIHGSVEIKRRLMDAGIPVYGITNFSSEKWPAERARYDFLRDFRDIVVSGDIGIVKPDPAIYHALIERNGLDVSRSVFIDDSPKNVAGAEAVGMDAIQFTTPEALSVALRDRGLPA